MGTIILFFTCKYKEVDNKCLEKVYDKTKLYSIEIYKTNIIAYEKKNAK